MQILTIRGENLASLAEPFEIDLSAEPLRSAGLFAITGDTGAGKSTILDAMCLALFSDCPRLSGAGVDDDVPDLSGQAVRSTDVRSILRRGAVSCWAEVDFIGLDGESYRAYWGARRAHGHADGRLQNVDRRLSRISDGQVLATQITQVNAEIVRLGGRKYDEFRRTVLLAQGDFGAFLQAPTSERAATLEKVTGTEIYRQISRTVFERHSEARAALETLEARRGDRMVLSVEERQNLEDERRDVVQQEQAAALDLSGVMGDLQRHAAVAEALARRRGAETASARAVEAFEKAAGDREQLAQIDRALPLRERHASLQVVEQELRGAAECLDAALLARGAAEKSVRDRTAASADAQAAHDRAEVAFKGFAPDWDEAARLDSAIEVALRELRDAEEGERGAQAACREADTALTDLNKDAERAQEQLTDASAALERDAAVGSVAAGWADILDCFESRSGHLADEGAARMEADRQKEAGSKAREQRQKLEEEGASDEKRLAQIAELIEDGTATIAKIEDERPAEEEARLARACEHLSEMRRDVLDAERAEDEGGRARAEAETAAALALEATEKMESARTRGQKAAGAAEALEKPLRRAEVAASEVAAQLRAQLESGQPCPVCGGCDHPMLEDPALAQAAADLQADMAEARKIHSDCQREYAEASRSKAAQEDRHATQLRAASAADQRARTARGAMEVALAQLMATHCVVEEPGQVWDIAAIDALRETLISRRAELQARLTSLGALHRTREQNRKERDRLQAAMAGRDRDAAGLSATIADADRAMAIQNEKAGASRRSIQDIERRLMPSLKVVGQDATTLNGAEAMVLAQLTNAVERFDRMSAKKLAAEQTIAVLGPKRQRAEAKAEADLASLQRAAKLSAARAHTLDELKKSRQGLLDGEATTSHRTRWNKIRLEAQTHRDDAARSLSDAQATRAGAQAKHDGDVAAHDLAKSRAASAERLLNEGLASAGMDLATLAGILEIAPADVQALRERLKEMERAVGRTAASAEDRAKDHLMLLEAGMPDRDPATLDGRRAEIEAQQVARRERLGAIAHAIEVDDQAKRSLADLNRSIREAKAEHDIWAAVNSAVGSRSGDKFTRIAQAVTLGMLVERANQHLVELKPRYRLVQAQELALHVVDADMADEVRSTRSLSGGELFLVSLSLALALSRMGGQGGVPTTLFIDEGFGSLDGASLDLAIDALERLQSQGRTIGVISHVSAMKERIPVQVKVASRGSGRSTIRIAAA